MNDLLLVCLLESLCGLLHDMRHHVDGYQAIRIVLLDPLHQGALGPIGHHKIEQGGALWLLAIVAERKETATE
jgi:hypothetical protein